MSATALLLAALLSAAAAPVKSPATLGIPVPGAIDLTFRVVVPALGRTSTPDAKELFAFYVGFFGADDRPATHWR